MPYKPISQIRIEQLAALTGPLEAHLDRIEGLRALNLYPELIVHEFNPQMLEGPDNAIGCAAIGLWQTLGHRHEGNRPDVTAVLSYYVNPQQKVTSRPPIPEISDARLNIFTGLTPQRIQFPTDRRDGSLVAIIEHPSAVYTNRRSGVCEESETLLFSNAHKHCKIAVAARGADVKEATGRLAPPHASLAFANLISLALRHQ